jgi:hypothetical protein
MQHVFMSFTKITKLSDTFEKKYAQQTNMSPEDRNTLSSLYYALEHVYSFSTKNPNFLTSLGEAIRNGDVEGARRIVGSMESIISNQAVSLEQAKRALSTFLSKHR